MTEMIERVARALCECDGRADPEHLEPGDALGIDGYENDEPCHFFWRHFEEPARAMLEAMRNPTEAMRAAGLAGYRFGAEHEGDDFAAAATQCWDAMLDAALGETP